MTTGSASYPKWGLGMTYDRYGNRSAQSVTAGTGVPANSVTIDATKNRLTGAPFAYDASGNMTNDGVNTLVYDGENHSVSATNGSTSGTYSYDGNGLRVKKISGATTTVYIFSGSKARCLRPGGPCGMIAEYDNGAAPTAPSREYIYSVGGLLAKIEAGTTTYYHADHLSNRVMTDSSGNITGQRSHYPYGETWYETGTTTKLKFTTYERDAESGNDFAIARSYVNRLGRFSSPDPLSGSTSDPQSLNRYPYARLDPANLIDPTGEIWACTTTIAGPGDHGETTCIWYPDPVDSSSFQCNGDACLPPIIIGGRLAIERDKPTPPPSPNTSGNCPPPLICTSGNTSSAPNNGTKIGTPKTTSQCSIYQDGSATGAALYTLCSKVFPNGPVSNQIRGCLQSFYTPGSGYTPIPVIVQTTPGSFVDVNSIIPGTGAHLTCFANAAGVF